ncbi:MAG: DUF1674 domain-containing protein [Rhizobiaceae bacterium]
MFSPVRLVVWRPVEHALYDGFEKAQLQASNGRNCICGISGEKSLPEEKSDQEMGKANEADEMNEEKQDLPEAAKRALAEAVERRKQMDAKPKPPREIDGREGPDPVRYGDWENKGIASDF